MSLPTLEYAQQLAEQGFVTLVFDASHQGASGGMPRFLADSMRRVGDKYSAVDYMTSLPYVDTSTDRRIKAIGTVSAFTVGAAS